MSTTTKRPPYPLQWPDGWPRTKSPDKPKFIEGHFARVRDSIIRQLQRKGGSHIVITSNLPTRADGLPYANARCDEPAVAVYWVEKGQERVIACDRWRTVGYNLRAIDLTINAMRGVDRWGSATMVEKVFAGFAALPAGSGEEHAPPPPASPVVRSWREVFDVPGVFSEHMKSAELLAFVKLRYRERIKDAHPDKGGDHAVAAELNAALAEAERELRTMLIRLTPTRIR